jgi:formate dehydrogenase (coenzyme F420) beta subunit
MPYSVEVSTGNKDVLASMRALLKNILESDEIGGLLAPAKNPGNETVMPTLLADSEQLDRVEPLTPAFPINAAKLVSRLTRKSAGPKIAALLRPCEMRAFVELVKLHQGVRENIFVIGIDCMGALPGRQIRHSEDDIAVGDSFYRLMLADPSGGERFQTASACRMCEHFIPQGCDLAVSCIGADLDQNFYVTAQTDDGEALLRRLDLPAAQRPAGRDPAVSRILESRMAHRDEVFDRTRENIGSIEKLSAYFSDCINCYNCRVACPVCYCRECVFETDVFEHEPLQYLKWAERKGLVKLPADTIFYHLTRLVHMSGACVGCGQCSNACPNEIPLVEIFRTVAHRTQAVFDYQAGRSLEEPPPMSVFREDEFEEIVGTGDPASSRR